MASAHTSACKKVNSPSLQIEDISLFKDLPTESLQLFRNAAQFKTVSKGTILYIQDDPAEWFYAIESGWVKLFRETLEGSEAIIDIMTSGHVFGENTIFENDCYSYSVEAVEDCRLIALPTKLLKEQVAKENHLAMNMLTAMSRYRLQQHREIEHFNVQNAPQRIGCFLLRLCKADAVAPITLHLPYDKTLIAGRLGMKPETFSRALSKLKDATKIHINGPSVVIEDIEELVDYTCTHCSSTFPCEDIK